MSGNPREHTRDKGFWDGGLRGHGVGNQSGGRSSGFPGTRKPKMTGIRIDLDQPPRRKTGETGETDEGGTEPGGTKHRPVRP